MSSNITFFEARMIYKKTHGQRVKNYSGTNKAPIQRTSIYNQTYVSWVRAHPVIQEQHPAASVTSRSLPSVSRSVGTTTHVMDVNKHVVPTKSSPPKDTKSNKPSLPKVSPVHESDAYFTVKTYKWKSKESSPMMCTSPQLSSRSQS